MFGSGPSFNCDTDIPDLSGKVILVTGGNNGLGAESVLQLAKHNARIYLAARAPSKAEAAIASIKKQVPNANIAFLELNLASLASVQKAADTFTASSSRLDILMNNAGVMAMPAGTTEDGYEIQFGTNHVGHALLTAKLLPTLRRTAAEEPNADVRIVNLSSGGHLLAPKGGLALADVKGPMADYNTWIRYGHSKLANILFTKDLAARYPEIRCMSLHPGSISTGLQDEFMRAHPWLAYPIRFIKAYATTPVAEGAKNQLWCAVSQEARSGCYYTPVGKENGGSGFARSEELREELAKWTEGELRGYEV